MLSNGFSSPVLFVHCLFYSKLVYTISISIKYMHSNALIIKLYFNIEEKCFEYHVMYALKPTGQAQPAPHL